MPESYGLKDPAWHRLRDATEDAELGLADIPGDNLLTVRKDLKYAVLSDRSWKAHFRFRLVIRHGHVIATKCAHDFRAVLAATGEQQRRYRYRQNARQSFRHTESVEHREGHVGRGRRGPLCCVEWVRRPRRR